MNTIRILTVCTGNICRSPMAEGMLRHFLPGRFQEKVKVSSAGTDALHGNRATELAVQVMWEYGVDIAGHRARLLNRQSIAEADLILVMERYHQKIVRSLRRFAGSKSFLMSTFDGSRAPYDVPDPIGGDLRRYRESARLIHDCLGGVFTHLEEQYET